MAFKPAEEIDFKIDDNLNALQDIGPYVTEVDGLPGTRTLADVTTVADTGRKSIPSIEEGDFTVRGWWSDDALPGIDATLGPLLKYASTQSYEYGPDGSTAGNEKYSGECWLTTYTIGSRVGEAVSWQATFRKDGVHTRGTYA